MIYVKQEIYEQLVARRGKGHGEISKQVETALRAQWGNTNNETVMRLKSLPIEAFPDEIKPIIIKAVQDYADKTLSNL